MITFLDACKHLLLVDYKPYKSLSDVIGLEFEEFLIQSIGYKIE